jgi:hypothetical protein
MIIINLKLINQIILFKSKLMAMVRILLSKWEWECTMLIMETVYMREIGSIIISKVKDICDRI